MDRDFFSLCDAALPSVAFDEKRNGIGGLDRGSEKQEGE
jgi:hypothetical protein